MAPMELHTLWAIHLVAVPPTGTSRPDDSGRDDFISEPLEARDLDLRAREKRAPALAEVRSGVG